MRPSTTFTALVISSAIPRSEALDIAKDGLRTAGLEGQHVKSPYHTLEFKFLLKNVGHFGHTDVPPGNERIAQEMAKELNSFEGSSILYTILTPIEDVSVDFAPVIQERTSRRPREEVPKGTIDSLPMCLIEHEDAVDSASMPTMVGIDMSNASLAASQMQDKGWFYLDLTLTNGK